MFRVVCVSVCVLVTVALQVKASLSLPSRSDYLQALASPQHQSTHAALSDWFSLLDENHDQIVDGEEIDRARSRDIISHGESLFLQHLDRDYSGGVSTEEFTMAPYELGLLELSTQLTLPTEEEIAANAFEGLDSEVSNQVELDSADHVMLELVHEAREAAKAAHAGKAKEDDEEEEESDDSSDKSKSSHGKTKRKKGAALPVSVFGVPSYSDEECVMCQYFVQRIQKEIYDRLTGSGGDSGGGSSPNGGLAGKAVAAQQLLEIRKTNGELQRKVGGRGIVRTAVQDVLISLCSSDRMPLLFMQYCDTFKEGTTVNAIRKGLFFNIPYTEVCSTAALCRDDSYIVGISAIHSQKTSLFLNSQRGVCGMLGGPHDRRDKRQSQLMHTVCDAHPNMII